MLTDTAALDRPECLRLLRGGGIGRIAFTERALPAVRPVSYPDRLARLGGLPAGPGTDTIAIPLHMVSGRWLSPLVGT